MAANSNRIAREKIYTTFQCTPPFLVCNIKQALGIDGEVPSLADRERNFRLLVENNFSGTGILENAPSEWPEARRNERTRAFYFLHRYALTSYGGVMVARILADNRTHTTEDNRFRIGIKDDDQAQGGFNFILFPSNFPALITFPGSTQLIDPLAIIHHEFGHTRLDARNRAVHLFSLNDERLVVIHHENPVRMLHGMEPRYTYYHQTFGTINIITGEIQRGELYTFSPSNPAVLVPPGKGGI